MRVLGVDGVRGRWLGALLALDPPHGATAVSWLLGTAEEVLAPLRVGSGVRLARADRVVACGIDVPVGLAPTGPRAADRQARALLGPGARRSVFATAPQPAFAVARRLGAGRASRPEADAASRAAGAGGVSTQSWGLAAKVLEVEDAIRALGAAGERVVEVHPETSFAVMARGAGTGPPAGKRTAAGVAHRVRLLGLALPGLDVLAALAEVGPGVPVDDALDALGAAWSARRHAEGTARVLGAGQAAVFSDGRRAPGRAVVVV